MNEPPKILFIAIFKNRDISYPLSSIEGLQRHNDFRWDNLYEIVSAYNYDGLIGQTKISLQELDEVLNESRN